MAKFKWNDDIFNGELNSDPSDWVSKMPDLGAIANDLKGSPGLSEEYGVKFKDNKLVIKNASIANNYFAELAFKNSVNISRQSIGEVAVSLGFLSKDIENLQNIYKENLKRRTSSF